MEMKICPFHCETLGISWRRSLRLGRLLEGAARGCSLLQSRYIWETTGEHVPVGSGNIVSAKIDYVENALYLQNLKIMSVCLFVCFLMYVGVCMCLSVYLCGCMCVCARMRACVCVVACLRVCVCACVRQCVYSHMRQCVCTASLQTRGEGNKAAAFEVSALRACVRACMRTCVCMYSRVRG